MRILQTLMAFSGNAPPQLAVTRELVSRGHEVRVLAHRAAAARVAATGAEVIEIERAVPAFDISRRETDTLRDWDARNKYAAGVRLRNQGQLAFLEPIAAECAELLADRDADVVLLDWVLLGAAIAAEAAGVPTVALVHCPYPLPVPGAPPLFSGAGWWDGPLGAARNRVLNRAFTRFADAGLPRLNRTRASLGLAPLAAWSEQLERCTEVHVLTAAELDFSSRGRLPENVHYVGPAFEPTAGDWAEADPETGDDRPLVIASFSTSYMNQADLAQRVLDALGTLPVRAILTAGPALAGEELRPRANARILEYVPHRALLPAAALMISHCGWQTVNAALAEGVPLLCVPDGRDQPDNAARVLAVGAGRRVSKRASPRRLRREIEAALADPGLRDGAGLMAGALGASDGARAGADRLETIGAARAQ